MAISHEDIVKQFIGSKAIDFAALGKFVAEHGATIAQTGRGDYGVRFGHYNILACFNIGPIVTSPIDLTRGISSEVTGR